MKHGNKLNICVFCGSSDGKNPKHRQAARALGEAMAAADIGLVYGGANVGLMGETARAVLNNGGHVTGVRPPGLPVNEVPLTTMQECIEVGSLHERKMIMFKRADAFVALPGGVGTLEELVEQITWVQLSLHHKPVIIANIDNYWSPLLDLLDHMKVMGFIAPNLQLKYHVVDDTRDIVPLVRRIIHFEQTEMLTRIL